MKIHSIVRPLLGVVFILTLTFSCKKKEGPTAGIEIQPDNTQLGLFTTDTFEVVCITQRLDSVRTESTTLNSIGSYQDPSFGTIRNSYVTQIRLSSENIDVNQLKKFTVDSVVLATVYNGYYGDLDAQNFYVYRVAEDLNPDSSFYSNYKIKTNTTGSKIDLIARKALKEIDLDYPHGTGHGVGYFLNVHEGPCGISRGNKTKFLEGMVISNEPGYYENNRFGIRIENLIMVKKKNKATFFEELTLVPIDKTLIEKDLLNLNEIRWLNNYHLKVFTSLKKFMSKDELPELKNYCSNI
jgi:hypothetical protein